jgi:hypothetical protein
VRRVNQPQQILPSEIPAGSRHGMSVAATNDVIANDASCRMAAGHALI